MKTIDTDNNRDGWYRQHTKDNPHEVGGADRVLDVKELTIWEAVALRALFHLPQELVSFVGAKKFIFRNYN